MRRPSDAELDELAKITPEDIAAFDARTRRRGGDTLGTAKGRKVARPNLIAVALTDQARKPKD